MSDYLDRPGYAAHRDYRVIARNGFNPHSDFPRSYAECEAIWTGTNRRKLMNNTYLERHTFCEDAYAVRLHTTAVIKFHADGRAVLETDGWQTATTRDRFRRAGFAVYTAGGVASLTTETGEYAYLDGITVHYGDAVTGHGGAAEEQRRERRRLLRRDPDAERLPQGMSAFLPGGNAPDVVERAAGRA